MPSFRGPLAAIVAALCLAIPASAFAQSAGDDQYADPFDETESSQPAAPKEDTPSRVVASPGTNTAAPTTSTSTTTTTNSTSAGQLAYTGFDLPLLFVTGAVMLLAGFTVRRAIAGPYARTR